MFEILKDLINHAGKFDGVDYLFLNPDFDGDTPITKIAAVQKDKSLVIFGTAKRIEQLEYPACLGGLKFLSKLISMDQIRGAKGSVSVTTRDDGNGGEAVATIDFKGPRVKVPYAATDPRILPFKVPIPKQQKIEVSVSLEEENCKEFSDVLALQRIKNPKLDEVSISIADDSLVATFGIGTERAELILVSGIEGELSSTKFNATRVQSALQLASASGKTSVSFNTKLMKLEFSSEHVDYTIYIPCNN